MLLIAGRLTMCVIFSVGHDGFGLCLSCRGTLWKIQIKRVQCCYRRNSVEGCYGTRVNDITHKHRLKDLRGARAVTVTLFSHSGPWLE